MDDDRVDPSEPGVAAFIRWLSEGEAKWSLYSVKAAVEDVAAELVGFRSATVWHRRVDVRRAEDGIADVAHLVPVVQSAGSRWSVIYRSLFFLGTGEIEGAPAEARYLSETLSTRSILFSGSGTFMSHKVFEEGDLCEEAEFEAGRRLEKFASILREPPQVDQVDSNLTDRLFSENRITVPICYGRQEDERVWLDCVGVSPSAIVRADVVDLGELSYNVWL